MVRYVRRQGLVLAIVTACAGTASASASETCSPLMDWNQIALDATVTAGQGAVPQIRSMAIVHASIHDALNAITVAYDTYLPAQSAPEGASAEAAVVGAASGALARLFSTQADWAARRSEYLERCGLAGDPGVGFGDAVAGTTYQLRFTDGSAQAQYPYTAPGAGLPGVWVPTGPAPAALPGWGKVTPWVLQSGSQFRPDPPPALDSGRYARDFNETKMLGAADGSSRTPDQTQIAIFWDGSPSAIWNSVARGVISARGLDLSSAARAFALMYIAGADASIACFDAKYAYNFWRPLTAIHRADEDGNDDTVPDLTWASLITTHPHPEYPSGHSTNSSAMATALALLLGDDPGVPIVANSPRNPTFPRNWSTFGEGVDEVIEARIYIGFHFRTADETGARMGRQVARYVFNHILRDN
jgi:hypothetical protein